MARVCVLLFMLAHGTPLVACAALGCSGSAPPSAPAVDAGPLESDAGGPVPQCTGWEPSATGLGRADLDRYGEAGLTEINALFCNPLMLEPQAELVFFVDVLDHFGIPRSDFTQGSWAQADNGRTEGGVAWTGGDLTVEEHHVVGRLSVPRTTASGTELVGLAATFLELHLLGIGSQPEVVLRWEQDYIR